MRRGSPRIRPMSDDRIERGSWDLAYDENFSLETLRLIIDLVKEFYEAAGRYPTATELRAALKKPGS